MLKTDKVSVFPSTTGREKFMLGLIVLLIAMGQLSSVLLDYNNQVRRKLEDEVKTLHGAIDAMEQQCRPPAQPLPRNWTL